MAVDTKALIEAHTLLDMAGRNFSVVQLQVKDLTHEDSLLQLPFRGNCLNWVVGHITQSRDKMLQLVNEPSIWTAAQIALFERESSPVTHSADAMRFEQILDDFQTAHERLTGKLRSMSIDDLAVTAKEVIKGISQWNIAEFLHFLLWHETYHVGQMELLRQLAGKNDKII